MSHRTILTLASSNTLLIGSSNGSSNTPTSLTSFDEIDDHIRYLDSSTIWHRVNDTYGGNWPEMVSFMYTNEDDGINYMSRVHFNPNTFNVSIEHLSSGDVSGDSGSVLHTIDGVEKMKEWKVLDDSSSLPNIVRPSFVEITQVASYAMNNDVGGAIIDVIMAWSGETKDEAERNLHAGENCAYRVEIQIPSSGDGSMNLNENYIEDVIATLTRR